MAAATDLTTLPRVKDYLGIDKGDLSSDGILVRLISAESRWFLQQIHRDLLIQTYTETFDGNSAKVRVRSYATPMSPYGGTSIAALGWAVNLDNYPITAITSVAVDGAAVPARPNLTSDGYSFLPDTGRLEMVGYDFTAGVQNITVVYSAGIYASVATVPADVEQAVSEMVGREYRKRDRLGLSTKSTAGEALTFDNGIPASVAATIDSYRRVQVG